VRARLRKSAFVGNSRMYGDRRRTLRIHAHVESRVSRLDAALLNARRFSNGYMHFIDHGRLWARAERCRRQCIPLTCSAMSASTSLSSRAERTWRRLGPFFISLYQCAFIDIPVASSGSWPSPGPLFPPPSVFRPASFLPRAGGSLSLPTAPEISR